MGNFCSAERFNSLFSYETSRKTVIQHWVVGLIHYIFLFAIFFYIFGVAMFWEQRYLKRYPVTGDFRYKLLEPQTPENEKAPSELPHCREYLKDAFHEHVGSKYHYEDGRDDSDGKYIEIEKTFENCKKSCLSSQEATPCIGINFTEKNATIANEGKCYHLFANEERIREGHILEDTKSANMDDGLEDGIVLEENPEWKCLGKKRGKTFLSHDNIGNCLEGEKYKKEPETKFKVTAPPPGQHSGNFAIFLGFKRDTQNDMGNDTMANEYTFFPNIGEHELEITHGYVTLQNLKRNPNDDRLSQGSRMCNGQLVDQDGNVLQKFGLKNTGKNTRDRIKISNILKAANVKSLNDPCDGHDDDCVPSKKEQFAHSFRNEGIVIYMRIEYLDDWYRNMEYTYKFDRMGHTDWSVYHDDKRFTALRMPVIITGSVGEFDVMNMIIEFTSTLFLLTIAELFIVYVVFKLFPQKELYQRAVYQKTKNFDKEHIDDMQERKVTVWEDEHQELVGMLKEIELTKMKSSRGEDSIDGKPEYVYNCSPSPERGGFAAATNRECPSPNPGRGHCSPKRGRQSHTPQRRPVNRRRRSRSPPERQRPQRSRSPAERRQRRFPKHGETSLNAYEV